MRLRVNHSLPLAALVLLGGCGVLGGHPEPAPLPTSGPAADYPMVIGDAYQVGGVTYRPEDRLNYDEVGYAATGVDGGQTISIAHKTLPLPSYVEVTSLESGKTILARVERRGPMANDKLVELSPGAAFQLGLGGRMTAPVRVRRVNPPEPERSALRSGGRAPERMETPKPLLNVLMKKLPDQQAVATHVPAPGLPDARPPAAKPAPASAPAVSPAPKPAPEPAPAPPQAHAGHLVVQAAAFSTRARANAVARELGGFVESAGSLWRVRVGPFASQADAQAALAKVRGAGYKDARIQSTR